MFPTLGSFIADRKIEFDSITADRKGILDEFAAYITSQLRAKRVPKLTFICTHNSRRSQLSQVWAAVAADVYNIGVETYSGGTEITAFHPNAVNALRRSGLEVASEAVSTNPVYLIKHSTSCPAQECFSKTYSQPPNPSSEYVAVMTCSQADDACPIVSGCDLRLPLRYEDPKSADGTEREAATYDERSKQICREMLYVMSKVDLGTR